MEDEQRLPGSVEHKYGRVTELDRNRLDFFKEVDSIVGDLVQIADKGQYWKAFYFPVGPHCLEVVKQPLEQPGGHID